MGWDYEYFPLPESWGSQRENWFPRVVGQTDGQLDVIKMSRTIREQIIKSQQMGVSLWGYGGEIYRGVYWKHEFWRAGKSSRLDYQRLMDYQIIPSGFSILKDEEQWRGVLRENIINRLKRVGEREPDWLNTVKLDMIGMFLERHACGTTIAAVLPEQRVILPFDFKENIAQICSVNPRWRTHAGLFRLILERINPGLAEIETADGGPAVPMHWNNFYRFIPYWLDSGEKLLWRLGYKAIGRPLWRRRNAGPAGKGYPSSQWMKDTLSSITPHYLLDYEHMRTASIYDQQQLRTLISDENNLVWANESLLGRILAIELALRSVNMDKDED